MLISWNKPALRSKFAHMNPGWLRVAIAVFNEMDAHATSSFRLVPKAELLVL